MPNFHMGPKIDIASCEEVTCQKGYRATVCQRVCTLHKRQRDVRKAPQVILKAEISCDFQAAYRGLGVNNGSEKYLAHV